MPSGGQQWSWEQWQSALSAVFFADRDASTPWVFFLDVDEAARLWPELDQPVADLSACVGQRLEWRFGNRLFDSLDLSWRRWKTRLADQPPPNLPVLAVSVLAASAMHTDELATSAAYYLRLAELLKPAASGADMLRIEDDLRDGFEVVAGWWDDLDRWVSARASALGTSTIETHETFWKVGYPISQALLRRSDRMLLTHFFAALDVKKHGVPPVNALPGLLSLWASRPRGFSETFTRALNTPGLHHVLGELVHRQASEWDGLVLTSRGRRQLDLRIALDLDAFTATWAVPVVEGVTHATLQQSGHRTVHLSQPAYGDLYAAEGMPPLAATLHHQQGLSLRGDGLEAVFRDQPILAFRGHPAAEWLSVDSVVPHEQHVLAVRPEHGAAMDVVLQTAARSGWRRFKQTPDKALVPGRVVYLNVVLENDAAFRNAVQGLTPSLVSALRPEPVARPRLVNGLKVAERLGNHHYLLGGPPDLLLPSSDGERRVAAALDGHHQDPAFLATGFAVPLRPLGLEAGPHRLEVDGMVLDFFLHGGDELPQAESRQLVWKLGEEDTPPLLAEGPIGPSAIAGAAVHGDTPHPFLLRRHARSFFISDQRGHVTSVALPPPTDWRSQLDLPESPYWEFTPPASAVWLLSVNQRSGALECPALIRWLDPHLTRLSPDGHEMWEQISLHWRSSSPLLDSYIRAWERVRRAG